MLPPYIYVLVSYSPHPVIRGTFVNIWEVQAECRKISTVESLERWGVYRLKEGCIDNVQKVLSHNEMIGKK